MGVLKGIWRLSGRCLEGVRRVLEGIWRLLGGCLEGSWKVSDWCLLGIKRVSGGYKEGVWRMSKMAKCLWDQNLLGAKIFVHLKFVGPKTFGSIMNLRKI